MRGRFPATVIALLVAALFILGWRLSETRRENISLILSVENLKSRLAASEAAKSQARGTTRRGQRIAPGGGSDEESPGEAETRQAMEARSRYYLGVDRRLAAAGEIQNFYGPLLGTLHLSPADEQKLKNLLLERLLAIDDARDVAREQHLGGAEYQAAVSAAGAQVDRDISRALGQDTAEKVQSLIGLHPDIDQILLNYAPQMAFAGDPLTGDQTVALAGILKEQYALPMAQAGVSSYDASTTFHTQNLDPATGLSDPDRQTIARAASVLRPDQLAILQTNLAAITARYSAKVPPLQPAR